MNVMRTEFLSKQKRLQNRRKRNLKPFFSGYHTVLRLRRRRNSKWNLGGLIRRFRPKQMYKELSSYIFAIVSNIPPSPNLLNIPVHNESQAQSPFRFSPKFSPVESDETADLAHLFSSEEPSQANETEEIFSERPNNSDFHFSPQNVKDSTGSTTLEFQKLLEPFRKLNQNSVVQDTSEESSVKNAEKTMIDSIEEKVSDAIFKTPRYSSTDRIDEHYDPQYSSSSSAAVERFNSPAPFEEYNAAEPHKMFNSPEPREPFNTQESRESFDTVEPRKRFSSPEPFEQINAEEPLEQFNTPEPRERFNTPESLEHFNATEPFGHLNTPKPFERTTENSTYRTPKPLEQSSDNSTYRIPHTEFQRLKTPDPLEQFNVFNLPPPNNQRSFTRKSNTENQNDDDDDDDDSPRLATLEKDFYTPVLNKNKHVTPPQTHSSSRSVSSSSGYRTPKSRPRKSPGTSSSNKSTTESGAFVLAVTEGRGHARGEVGIAAIDPKRPHLVLCQISDNQRYVNSLTKINVFEFFEVIVPNTFVDGATPNKLYCDIRTNFPMVLITSVQRRHFNEALGIDLIKQYCSPESNASVTILLRDKFYALSAAAALIKYVEYSQNVRLAPRSLRVEYQGTEDTMIIDLDTANLLELVMCTNHPETNVNHSLLGVVKYCHTKGGVRLLRANILQPSCSLKKIENRLNCVTELVNNPLLLCSLEAAVANFTNTENLLNLCMYAPQQDGLKAAEYQLRMTLLLKTTLEHLPELRSSLEEAKSDFFCEMRENLEDLRYKIILDRILETILENAKTVKGSIAAHLHGCFAIKQGINSLLDVAKKTYCEIVQKISDHITKLRETHNMSLRISYSANKGFHIQYTIPPEHRNMEESDLPKEFILVQKTKSTFSFYTTDLVALDQRSQNVLNEIKLMTNVLLFELLTDIREHIGCLFNLCEYLAELDVVVSFAHVGSGTDYVRPKFGDELNLKSSRHPILDVVHDGEVIPNDAYARKDRNFMILTGPNQSGKSIYIRQMALLQIMAQIGCYVPAKEATFRLTDRIFSRLSLDDSIECNASTLMVEMRDIKFLKQNVTSHSLVIIDELCRGTSVEEGTSVAFAICEELLDSKAFIFFTTHYLFLTKLEEMYYNVTNYHFDTKFELKELERTSVEFTHLRKPGVTKAEMYGIHLAELTSFPRDICLKAKEIAAVLCTERKASKSVRGLLAKYNLAVEFENECDLEDDWMKIDSVIQKFRELYLNLINPEYIEDEESFLTQEDEEEVETSSAKETSSTSMENVFKQEEIVYHFIRDKNPAATQDMIPSDLRHPGKWILETRGTRFDLYEKEKKKRLVLNIAAKIKHKYKKLRIHRQKRLKGSK